MDGFWQEQTIFYCQGGLLRYHNFKEYDGHVFQKLSFKSKLI